MDGKQSAPSWEGEPTSYERHFTEHILRRTVLSFTVGGQLNRISEGPATIARTRRDPASAVACRLAGGCRACILRRRYPERFHYQGRTRVFVMGVIDDRRRRVWLRPSGRLTFTSSRRARLKRGREARPLRNTAARWDSVQGRTDPTE